MQTHFQTNFAKITVHFQANVKNTTAKKKTQQLEYFKHNMASYSFGGDTLPVFTASNSSVRRLTSSSRRAVCPASAPSPAGADPVAFLRPSSSAWRAAALSSAFTRAAASPPLAFLRPSSSASRAAALPSAFARAAASPPLALSKLLSSACCRARSVSSCRARASAWSALASALASWAGSAPPPPPPPLPGESRGGGGGILLHASKTSSSRICTEGEAPFPLLASRASRFCLAKVKIRSQMPPFIKDRASFKV
mmetsp:Transcript_25037/g.54595  ORF Transcript_25037/g.54595 Transcript_25037/m.54595 type:complete len:253 (+) Transcript_25037:185-943(+)